MARTLLGVETHTLEEVVNTFMVMQGNTKRSHFADYMITAHEVWKKLFRSTIWSVQQLLIDVSDDNTIYLPEGVERLLGISVIDHRNNLQPLTYDPNINTLQVSCHPKKCSCTTCNGEDTLCEALDTITMRQEAIVIDTVTYYKKIWNKRVGGDVMEVIETPVKDGDTLTTFVTETKICDLDLDEKGCILPTDANRDRLIRYCGCYIPSCHKKMCDDHHCKHIGVTVPPDFSFYGFYKQDVSCERKIHLQHIKAKKVIISFQPSSEYFLDGAEIMVPEYAKEAVMFGMGYFSVAYRPNIGPNEKLFAKGQWEESRRKLFSYMNPISMEEFSRLPARIRLW